MVGDTGMKYNEFEFKKLMRKGINDLSVDEQISLKILNFIRTLHLKQDFYSALFNTQYFGDIEMMFKKKANCLIGHCRVYIKDSDRVIDYLFTENGYEGLSGLMEDRA